MLIKFKIHVLRTEYFFYSYSNNRTKQVSEKTAINVTFEKCSIIFKGI